MKRVHRIYKPGSTRMPAVLLSYLCISAWRLGVLRCTGGAPGAYFPTQPISAQCTWLVESKGRFQSVSGTQVVLNSRTQHCVFVRVVVKRCLHCYVERYQWNYWSRLPKSKEVSLAPKGNCSQRTAIRRTATVCSFLLNFRFLAMEKRPLERKRCAKVFLAICTITASFCVITLFITYDGQHAKFARNRWIGQARDINWEKLYRNLNLGCRPKNDTRTLQNFSYGYLDRLTDANPNCDLRIPRWKDSRSSRRVMSQVDWYKMMSLMKTIDMVLVAENIPYMMFGGALFG